MRPFYFSEATGFWAEAHTKPSAALSPLFKLRFGTQRRLQCYLSSLSKLSTDTFANVFLLNVQSFNDLYNPSEASRVFGRSRSSRVSVVKTRVYRKRECEKQIQPYLKVRCNVRVFQSIM